MRRWLLACIVLTGCASQPTQAPMMEPGRYADYRAFATDQTEHMKWNNVPAPLQAELRACLIQTTFQNYTPAELEKLDAWARGEQQLSVKEIKDLNAQAAARAGATDSDLLNAVRHQCPETVAKVEPYAKSPDFKMTVEP